MNLNCLGLNLLTFQNNEDFLDVRAVKRWTLGKGMDGQHEVIALPSLKAKLEDGVVCATYCERALASYAIRSLNVWLINKTACSFTWPKNVPDNEDWLLEGKDPYA